MRISGCPFCGSKNVYVKEYTGGPGIGIDGYVVKCIGCMAEGPYGLKSEAIKAWNKCDGRQKSETTGNEQRRRE